MTSSISSSSDAAKPSLCLAMQPSASFNTMSIELLSKILGLLSPREQLSCRPVCKKWDRVIQKIPPKVMTQGLNDDCDYLTQIMSVKQYLADGLVNRYHKAMNLEPEVIQSTVIEAPFSNIQDSVINLSCDKNIFFAQVQNFYLTIQISYQYTTTLYIDAYNQGYKIKVQQTPADMRVEKIQFLFFDEILLARVAWNKPSDKSCKAVQVLMYHFEIGRCIVNTHSTTCPLHAKLLKTLTEYELLDSLNVSLQNKGGKYTKTLQIAAVNPTTKQRAILEYNLDIRPNQ